MRKIYSEFDNVSVPSESGTHDSGLYDKIQKAAVGTTLPELIKKYESGEITDFNFRQGQYLDLSEFPSNAIDALNLLKGAEYLDIINDYLRSLNDKTAKKIKKVLFSSK